MRLISIDMEQGKPLASRFTCDGENISPNLSWTEPPVQTKSFALVLHDPDPSPPGGFVHWVVYQIPANVTALPTNVPPEETIAGLGVQGVHGAGGLGYTGPCPPSGTHEYFFHLYALKEELVLPPRATEAQLQEAMKSHILEHAELMVTYRRTS